MPSPQPFTYNHFKQALFSGKEDALLYYIDEAVGIYCTLFKKNVGPRPTSVSGYSTEYSDAYEAANYAIFRVGMKIGSYNPNKGSFKGYLNQALANALKDIQKEDGKSDFFDQTSKKKRNKDEEPEKHARVNVDNYRGSTDCESTSEPDDDAEQREERIRKHKNEALEVMIKYIDSLPSKNKAAIYASAFGQALRPDIEGYGRNYADVLAKMYGTTASYIRQLAIKGKNAALAEARRQGFSERSLNEVSIGFLQVRKPEIPDIRDQVIKASSELTPYQQFIFLRHLASIVDNEG